MPDNITFSEYLLKDISNGDIGINLNKDDYLKIESYKKDQKILKKKESDSFLDFRIKTHGNFIWMFLNQGNSKPRSENVFNKKSKLFEENPRSKDQIELNKQSFLAIHKLSATCFISNSNKKDYFEKYIQQILSKKVGFAPVFTKIEDIANSLRTVEDICFSIPNSLFSEQEPVQLFGTWIETLGLGAAEEYRIYAKFASSSKIQAVINFLEKFGNSASIKYVTCTCKDSKKLDCVLNTDGISRKMSFPIIKDENGFIEEEYLMLSFEKEFKKCYGE